MFRLPQHAWDNSDAAVREGVVYYNDASFPQKFCYRNKISIRRYQHCNIIIRIPRQANHISSNARVDAFFLGAAQIGATFRQWARTHCGVTRWAGRESPGASRSHRDDYPRKFADGVCHPAAQPGVFIAAWIVGAIDIHSLVHRQSCGVDYFPGQTRQAGPQAAPVNFVSFVIKSALAHLRCRSSQKSHENAYPQSSHSGRIIRRKHKNLQCEYRGAASAPGVLIAKLPIAPYGRAASWRVILPFTIADSVAGVNAALGKNRL